jgi:hypothetical protein
MTRQGRRIALALALAVLVTGVARAQEGAKGTPAELLAGKWEGQRQGDGGATETVTLQFDVKGGAFTGTMWRQGREFGAVTKGMIDGAKVSWETNDIAFTGVMTGASMHVVIHFDNADIEFDVAKKDKA